MKKSIDDTQMQTVRFDLTKIGGTAEVMYDGTLELSLPVVPVSTETYRKLADVLMEEFDMEEHDARMRVERIIDEIADERFTRMFLKARS